ncbi:MAG: hypothetical protein J6U54_11710 [Clostridiales bacterium]|nr:hypothetical protein [Clostridiales bacterium]
MDWPRIALISAAEEKKAARRNGKAMRRLVTDLNATVLYCLGNAENGIAVCGGGVAWCRSAMLGQGKAWTRDAS